MFDIFYVLMWAYFDWNDDSLMFVMYDDDEDDAVVILSMGYLMNHPVILDR